jgi:hypothetical protein
MSRIASVEIGIAASISTDKSLSSSMDESIKLLFKNL